MLKLKKWNLIMGRHHNNLLWQAFKPKYTKRRLLHWLFIILFVPKYSDDANQKSDFSCQQLASCQLGLFHSKVMTQIKNLIFSLVCHDNLLKKYSVWQLNMQILVLIVLPNFRSTFLWDGFAELKMANARWKLRVSAMLNNFFCL